MNAKELTEIYSQISPDINDRKAEFSKSYGRTALFSAELVFCLCTPQTNAHRAWNAAQDIMKKKLYQDRDLVAASLYKHGVRFYNNKASYIYDAMQKSDKIYRLIHRWFKDDCPEFVVRNWLIENIKGYGFKEASHFLRNVGHANDLSILDRHILRCLADYKVIDAVPKTLNSIVYQDIECRMMMFSNRIGIDLTDLDFVFWYRQNGEIFK